MAPDAPTRARQNFSEEDFYLREFHGRTLALAVASACRTGGLEIARVLEDLQANQTGVLVFSDGTPAAPELGGIPRLGEGPGPLAARVWRGLQASPVLVVELPPDDFVAGCHRLALTLGLRKLVWLDEGGGLQRPDGSRASFVDLEQIEELRAAGGGERTRFLVAIEGALRAGLPEVNLCSPAGLGEELFSYAGSGTLFTRRRYLEVRALGLDDFSAADALISRGVEEGYLAPRNRAQRDEALAHASGAFVEGVSLAGVGALLRCGQAGEIACLYALTRFLGEGIGGHLVESLWERSLTRGDTALFACTTHARSAAFFERNGFERVAPDLLPDEKWRDYDNERRERLICLRRPRGS
ncbi:MAG: GNAT family N-acetyltransferase [Myxococcota bacterium]